MNDRDRLDLARERLAMAQRELMQLVPVAWNLGKEGVICRRHVTELSNLLMGIEDALGRPVTPRTLFSVEG